MPTADCTDQASPPQPVTADERGVSRPQGVACDIGAYEATPPVAVTGAATAVTPFSATLNGTVNSANLTTNYHFEYGTTTAYGSSTPPESAGSDDLAHTESAAVSGLKPQTTYHFRIVATNAVGTSRGDDRTFTTPAALKPVVFTAPATGVRAGSATLNATVNPEGSATSHHFQYGRSIGYGSSTPSRPAGADSATHAESWRITGLQPGATYHFRIVATNAAGTSVGADRTFQTARLPLLRLGVSPHTVRAGRRTCPRFTVRSGTRRIAGARIRFAGHTVRSSRRGTARICGSLTFGPHRARAMKAGYGAGATIVLATRPAGPPRFTG